VKSWGNILLHQFWKFFVYFFKKEEAGVISKSLHGIYISKKDGISVADNSPRMFLHLILILGS